MFHESVSNFDFFIHNDLSDLNDPICGPWVKIQNYSK